ncbi:MAG: MBL fold metallo-hydrolase [Pseudomonadota bacterium]
MKPIIKFCGAAGTVTGSCYWIKGDGFSFLVDCGTFQGSKSLKELNYDAFPFSPAEIDFVLLTHAHIDHSGLIPKLIREGFEGPIYATEGTRDLVSFMWPDSGYIQETEVKFLNQKREQRGRKTVEPIYTRLEGEDAAKRVTVIEYDQWIEVSENIRARFWNAGHILGAASIEIEIPINGPETKSARILFSGDLGPEHKLFHPDPDGPRHLDFLVCEATYGDRLRPALDIYSRRKRLGEEINKALKNGEGVLVIPAFSVERTQELLLDIDSLMKIGDINDSLVFLDSPLAIRATKTFASHASDLEDINASKALVGNENFIFTETVQESKRINSYANGVIIIAASGMCEAGRIRHHLKRRLWQDNTTIMMVGFQAAGTLGRLLLEGKKTVRIQGETVQVDARIVDLDIYSGHADAEGLQDWVLERLPVHGDIFLSHGEPEALAALKERLARAGLSADKIIIPALDEEFELSGQTASPKVSEKKPRLKAEAVARLDWHNDLAQLSLDIVDELEKAADEKARQKILRKLRRALDVTE